MKKIVVIGIGAVLVVIGGLFFIGGGDRSVSEGHKVGVTIFPLYDMTRTIAGDETEVVLLLPPGASPHTFDPQPSTLQNLQGAQAVFVIGNGLDDWSHSLADAVGAPVVSMDRDVELRASVEEDEHDHDADEHDEHDEHEEEEEEHHHHGPNDPHYWLSIANAAHIAITVADELGQLDPDNAELYLQRADAYAQELVTLREELQAQTSVLPDTHVISLHDAWYYFADEFGLEIVGTFEPSAGKEPSPQYLATLAGEAEEHDVSTLFIEPQLSASAITAFASDHGLHVATLDPLGGVAGRMSYSELMRYNVEQVVNALSDEY